MAGSARVIGLCLERSEMIIGSLAHEGLLGPDDVQVPSQASLQDLEAAHFTGYLDQTTNPAVLAEIFGVDPGLVMVDEVLSAQRYAVGGTVSAARAVAAGQIRLAVNLGGGFHHAEPDKGAGFCVYNDVAVAIRLLRSRGFDGRIAVIDLDYHEGNGNVSCFANDRSVGLYSIHGSQWTQLKSTGYSAHVLSPGSGDVEYLGTLRSTLPGFLSGNKPELVFYIAGNDVLWGDRLGDFRMTPKGVLDRDVFVHNTVKNAGAGMVVMLGGGYTSESWKCMLNFLRYLLTDQVKCRWSAEPRLRSRFNRIAARIWRGTYGMNKEEKIPDVLEFSEADLLGDISRVFGGNKRLLGYFSQHGIELALEHFGILDQLRKKGFRAFRIEADASDQERQLIRVHGRRGGEAENKILIELVMSRLSLLPEKGLGLPEVLRFIAVEWLMMNDPGAGFSNERPQLPGQTHPGLGIGDHVRELLVQVCGRLELDGIHGKPSHYHNAILVSQWFRFVDPADEGKMMAMKHVLADKGMARASGLVTAGKLRLADGAPLLWNPSDQVLPVSPRLKAYFDSPAYLEASRAVCVRLLGQGLHAAE